MVDKSDRFYLDPDNVRNVERVVWAARGSSNPSGLLLSRDPYDPWRHPPPTRLLRLRLKVVLALLPLVDLIRRCHGHNPRRIPNRREQKGRWPRRVSRRRARVRATCHAGGRGRSRRCRSEGLGVPGSRGGPPKALATGTPGSVRSYWAGSRCARRRSLSRWSAGGGGAARGQETRPRPPLRFLGPRLREPRSLRRARPLARRPQKRPGRREGSRRASAPSSRKTRAPGTCHQ